MLKLIVYYEKGSLDIIIWFARPVIHSIFSTAIVCWKDSVWRICCYFVVTSVQPNNTMDKQEVWGGSWDRGWWRIIKQSCYGCWNIIFESTIFSKILPNQMLLFQIYNTGCEKFSGREISFNISILSVQYASIINIFFLAWL